MIERVLLVLLAMATAAHAQPAPAPGNDAVALLPLDADARLELYGQPVASEIARALVAGGIDVVVVGPKMAVPERAKLVIDGTIKNKGDAVVLAIRVRNRIDGTVVQPLESTAPNLPAIDKAAADLAARALPIVRDRLAELARGAGNHRTVIEVPAVKPAPVSLQPMLLAITGQGAPTSEPLRVALIAAIDPWVRANRREPRPIDARRLARTIAPRTVAESKVDRGVVFEVLGYDVSPGAVPLARARVRVRVADASRVLFDRVIVTDTIVGDRDMRPEALVARVAAEVLQILRPHIRRAVPAWR